MDYRVLGPLEVRDGGRVVALGTARDRALLAVLLLHRGEVVSTDDLIDALWGERPPPTAAKGLQVHISHLRKALGASAIATRDHGYALAVAPGDVDADRFERATAEGRRLLAAGEARRAAEVLREGLGMWRGPPLADVAYESFAEAEAARLGELRLAALEDRVEADLALGRDAAVVAELEGLVRTHPLRERLRGLLMLALYRCGRQADALERYREGRAALVEELGLEPGRELSALHEAILRQDPALDGPPRRRPRRVTRRSAPGRWLVASGAALLLGAVTAAILLARGGPATPALLGADTVGAVDPATGNIAAPVPVPGVPDRLAAWRGTVWVVGDASHTLSAIDVRRRAVASSIAPGGTPSDVAAGSDAVWVLDEGRRVVTQFRPGYDRAIRRVALHGSSPPAFPRALAGFDAWAVAAASGAAWITDGSSWLTRVDARTGHRTRLDVRAPLDGVTVSGGDVWAISGARAMLLRIRGRSIRRIPIAGVPGFESPYPIALTAGFGAIWVLNGNGATVTRVDPRIGAVVTTIRIGVAHNPLSLAAGAGAVWVAGNDGTLSRIDPGRNRVAAVTAVGHGLEDLAVAGGRVWVSAARGFVPQVDRGPAPTAAAVGHGQVQPVGGSTCTPVESRPGDRPQVLIASDLPVQGIDGTNGLQMAAAIRDVLRRHGFRAGRYAIGYQLCDDSNADGPVDAKCRANARIYARNPTLSAVIGPYASGCAAAELPTLNGAPGGPIAVVSPSNTYVGFTRHGPGSRPSEPARFAPSGRRSYVRLMAPDDVQGAADADIAQRLGVRRVYVLSDGELYGDGIAAAFRRAARRLGIDVVGTGSIFGGRRLARRVRASGAQGVFLGGFLTPSSPALIRTLRRAVPSLQVLAPDGFEAPDVAALTGPAADGMTVSVSGVAPSALRGDGARFVRRFGALIGARPDVFAVYAAQATEVLLDAIRRSDGSRRSIVRALFATRVRTGLIGSFAFTPQGDITRRAVTIYRVSDGALRPGGGDAPPATLVGDG